MSLGEIFGVGGGGLFVILSLIQISPIEISPWSAIGKALGKCLNSDVLSEISDLKKNQTSIKEQLEEHIRIDDERDADMRRQRILQFNADLLNGARGLSHEFFVDILHEIDIYETYCEDHPRYSNSRAVLAIANIKRVCEEKERDGSFAN